MILTSFRSDKSKHTVIIRQKTKKASLCPEKSCTHSGKAIDEMGFMCYNALTKQKGAESMGEQQAKQNIGIGLLAHV